MMMSSPRSRKDGIEISKDLSDDAFEAERVKLEVLMNESVKNEND